MKDASSDDKPALEKLLKSARDDARVNSQRTPPYELIYGVADRKSTGDAAIQLKGDPTKPGDLVPRKFLTALGARFLASGHTGSGRLELAQWMFEPSNPLPARVMVNRIWQYHLAKPSCPHLMILANKVNRQLILSA